METSEINEIAGLTAAWLDISPAPQLARVTKHKGFASKLRGTFTLPEWIFGEPREYIVAYIVHEVAHFHPDGRGHDRHYLTLEDRGLEYFGLRALVRSPRGNRYVRALAGPSGYIAGSGRMLSPYKRHWLERLPKDPNPCQCGCGGFPKGQRSRFLPGHDARVHG